MSIVTDIVKLIKSPVLLVILYAIIIIYGVTNHLQWMNSIASL